MVKLSEINYLLIKMMKEGDISTYKYIGIDENISYLGQEAKIELLRNIISK